MQSLARGGYTDAEIRDLLKADSLAVSAGLDLLDAQNRFIADISDDLAGGSVARSMDATIHGVCDLTLTRELAWGVDLVRPYMTLTAGAVTARFNLGVYMLTTPERKIGETPETYTAQGYDRLYLLNREVGADYSTPPAGTTYRAAILQAFTDAGLTDVRIEGAAADNTLPKVKTWLLVPKDQSDPDQTDTPVTWLRVVNDLLKAINFRSVWADQDGVFRCDAYRPPASRGVEYEWDADDPRTIVGEERTLTEDVWKMPNRWVFRQTNRADGAPAPTEGDGIYTVNLPDEHLMSAASRGLVWTSVIDYEAATHGKLVELGDRRVATDKQVASVLDMTTGPFPAAGHADIFTYTDTALSGSRKVQAVSWQMPLDGSDMNWTMERVT